MSEDAELEKDIEWFESMDSSLKDNMIEDPLKFDEDEQEKFFNIIRETRNTLEENNDKEKTIEFLVDNGMSTSYATIIVNRVIEMVPPPNFVLPYIERLEYEEFKTFINNFINMYYTNKTPNTFAEECAKDLDIGEETAFSLANEFITILNQYLRGQVTLSNIFQHLTLNGLSKARAEYVTEIFDQNESEISKKLTFSNIQDILFYEMEGLKRRQKRIEELLQQALEQLKKEEKE